MIDPPDAVDTACDEITKALRTREQWQARCEAAEARVRVLEQPWQPIASVPRHRMWVVVTDADQNYGVYRFGDGLISEPDEPHWTHWMPLPAPPREAK